MIYKIENNNIILEINSLGAEMTSLVYKEKTIIRKVDKWNKISPVLFPFISTLNNNIVKGVEVPKHGYIRLSEFTVTQKSKNSITFMNKNDRKYFDYECEFYVTYSLNDDGIEVKTRVCNNGIENFKYSIGHHPAIIVDDKEYIIKFENRDTIFQGDEVKIVNKSELCREDFNDVDTILINDVNNITISYQGLGICFKSLDFNTFGIWSNLNPNSDFVCIEPWEGFSLSDNSMLTLCSNTQKEYVLNIDFIM